MLTTIKGVADAGRLPLSTAFLAIEQGIIFRHDESTQLSGGDIGAVELLVPSIRTL